MITFDNIKRSYPSLKTRGDEIYKAEGRSNEA